MKRLGIFLLLAVVVSFVFPLQQVQSAGLSPNDLLEAVNNYRLINRVPVLEKNENLMVSAQIQSDYLGSTYGENFPSDGHIGAGGTLEYERAVSAGYLVGPNWDVDEIWYGGDDSATVQDALYGFWNKSTVHKNALLNLDNVHIGTGISEGNGFRYFIVVFGLDHASGGSPGGGVASTVPTTAVTPKVAPVAVASPGEDGSIIHEVKSGQALWSIAEAYEVTIDQLIALNNLSEDTVIYIGQNLLIRLAYTPTPTPTSTQTPRPPTRTPIPAQTAQNVNTQTPENDSNSDDFLGLSRQTMGLILILVCGVGLVLIVVGTKAKDKKPKTPPSE
jgi:LysM repeat protein